MLLVLSITFHRHYYIWGCMYSTGPFQWLKGYTYSSCYYHQQIGSINSTHYYHTFFCSCVPGMFVHHILSLIACTFRGNRDFVLIIIEQFMMSENSWICFSLQNVFVCLYSTPSQYHQCAILSDDIEITKRLSDIFCRVCGSDWSYSLSYLIYNVWGCVFSVYSFPLWWLIEYILCLFIIIKSEVWIIVNCLGLGHESMVCAVCLSMFCKIMEWSCGKTV